MAVPASHNRLAHTSCEFEDRIVFGAATHAVVFQGIYAPTETSQKVDDQRRMRTVAVPTQKRVVQNDKTPG